MHGSRSALIPLVLLALPSACSGEDETATITVRNEPGSAAGQAGSASGEGGGTSTAGDGSGGSAPVAAGAASGSGPAPGPPPSSPEGPAPNGGEERPPEPGVATEPLPDLVLDAAYLIDTTVEDDVEIHDTCLVGDGCVTGLGPRRVVRFGSRTGNVGSADLRIGAPELSNPYWTRNACNSALDLAGFARYELRDASTGEVVVTGFKNGFCIADAEPWDVDEDRSCERFTCNDQGISRGCADNYGSALQCQWVDITDVPPGAYSLRVMINAARSIVELDYANNVVDVNLEITEDEVRVER